MNAGEEIRVGAHGRGQVERAGGGLVQETQCLASSPLTFPRIRRKHVREPAAQFDPRISPERHECVERRARRGPRGFFSLACEETCLDRSLQVEDLVADRDAAARIFVRRREHAERQVLYGKRFVAIGGTDPALTVDVVCFVGLISHVYPSPQPSPRLGARAGFALHFFTIFFTSSLRHSLTPSILKSSTPSLLQSFTFTFTPFISSCSRRFTGLAANYTR